MDIERVRSLTQRVCQVAEDLIRESAQSSSQDSSLLTQFHELITTQHTSSIMSTRQGKCVKSSRKISVTAKIVPHTVDLTKRYISKKKDNSTSRTVKFPRNLSVVGIKDFLQSSFVNFNSVRLLRLTSKGYLQSLPSSVLCPKTLKKALNRSCLYLQFGQEQIVEGLTPPTGSTSTTTTYLPADAVDPSLHQRAVDTTTQLSPPTGTTSTATASRPADDVSRRDQRRSVETTSQQRASGAHGLDFYDRMQEIHEENVNILESISNETNKSDENCNSEVLIPRGLVCLCGRTTEISPVTGICLRCVQDSEYEASLLADQQKSNTQTNVIHLPLEQSTEPDCDAQLTDVVHPSLEQLRTIRLTAFESGLRTYDKNNDSYTLTPAIRNWTDDLATIQKSIDKEITPSQNKFNVDRADVFGSFIITSRRRNFDPMSRIDVVFVDALGAVEGAIDSGGPTREFLRLLVKEVITGPCFEGPAASRNLRYSTECLHNKTYRHAGVALAISLLHGGPAPLYLSGTLYELVIGGDLDRNKLTIDMVSDDIIREALTKIADCDNLNDISSLLIDYMEVLRFHGCLRNVRSLSDRDVLIKDVIWSTLVGRMQMALDQFREGLNSDGLLEVVRGNSVSWKVAFTGGVSEKLTAQYIMDVFKFCLSPEGSNCRVMERRMLSYWRNWLIDVEGGEYEHFTLEQVLIFATGADSEPPLGFEVEPSLEMISYSNFPLGNTCALVLRLPITEDFDTFAENMVNGIRMSPGFGLH